MIDCIYKGGTAKNISDEVLPRLLPKCGNSSGFRKVSRVDDPSKMAYVVLYTSMSEFLSIDFDYEEQVFACKGNRVKVYIEDLNKEMYFTIPKNKERKEMNLVEGFLLGKSVGDSFSVARHKYIVREIIQ